MKTIMEFKDFIAFSDNDEEFNKICNDILNFNDGDLVFYKLKNGKTFIKERGGFNG